MVESLESKRITVALTGASGAIYGVELVKALVQSGIETYVILSEWAKYVLKEETNTSLDQLRNLTDRVYSNRDMASPLASSSTLIDGMVVMPATVKTVSNIANATTGDLISRAADIMLKMQRPLIIGIRETPLSPPCLHNLAQLSTYGVVIMPLSPGFYHYPKTIQDLVDFIIGKTLDILRIPNEKYRRWKSQES